MELFVKDWERGIYGNTFEFTFDLEDLIFNKRNSNIKVIKFLKKQEIFILRKTPYFEFKDFLQKEDGQYIFFYDFVRDIFNDKLQMNIKIGNSYMTLSKFLNSPSYNNEKIVFNTNDMPRGNRIFFKNGYGKRQNLTYKILLNSINDLKNDVNN